MHEQSSSPIPDAAAVMSTFCAMTAPSRIYIKDHTDQAFTFGCIAADESFSSCFTSYNSEVRRGLCLEPAPIYCSALVPRSGLLGSDPTIFQTSFPTTGLATSSFSRATNSSKLPQMGLPYCFTCELGRRVSQPIPQCVPLFENESVKQTISGF